SRRLPARSRSVMRVMGIGTAWLRSGPLLSACRDGQANPPGNGPGTRTRGTRSLERESPAGRGFAGVPASWSVAVPVLAGAVDDPHQVGAGIEATLSVEDQPAPALVDQLGAGPPRAAEERDERLPGHVAALVGGFAGDIDHLLERHADLELGELAAGRRL